MDKYFASANKHLLLGCDLYFPSIGNYGIFLDEWAGVVEGSTPMMLVFIIWASLRVNYDKVYV